MCRGYGVRANEASKRGTFLLEYVGEIIDEQELAVRMETARIAGVNVVPCYLFCSLH